MAFPAISCGVYGYPLEDAARVAFETTVEFLRRSGLPEKVIFVLFDDRTHAAFTRVWDELRPAGD